MKTHWKT